MALTHGEAQSRAHAEAARTTAQTKVNLERVVSLYPDDDDAVDRAMVAYYAAKNVERKAYLAYTNPFGVVKTFS